MSGHAQFTTAADYWHGMVEPDFQDCCAQPDNLRRAFHCATSLFHLADWVFQTHKAAVCAAFNSPNEKAFADALEAVNPDFALVRGVANAAKHLQLKKRRPVPNAPISAANTYVESVGFGAGSFGTGSFGGSRVVIEGATDREFEDMARSVHGMWTTLNATHGWWVP